MVDRKNVVSLIVDSSDKSVYPDIQIWTSILNFRENDHAKSAFIFCNSTAGTGRFRGRSRLSFTYTHIHTYLVGAHIRYSCFT